MHSCAHAQINAHACSTHQQYAFTTLYATHVMRECQWNVCTYGSISDFIVYLSYWAPNNWVNMFSIYQRNIERYLQFDFFDCAVSLTFISRLFVWIHLELFSGSYQKENWWELHAVFRYRTHDIFQMIIINKSVCFSLNNIILSLQFVYWRNVFIFIDHLLLKLLTDFTN